MWFPKLFGGLAAIVLITLIIPSEGIRELNKNHSTTTTQYFLYMMNTSDIELDGIITHDEYPEGIDIYSVGGINFATLYWGHNGTNLFVGIQAKLNGWVGFGQGENGMIGAAMTYGYVTGGETYLVDAHGDAVQNTNPRVDDVNNILGSSGSETTDETTLEFTIPLNSNDENDAAWDVGGTFGFFIAGHKSSDIMVYHTYHTARDLKVTLIANPTLAPRPVLLTKPEVTKTGDMLFDIGSTVTDGTVNLENKKVIFAIVTSYGYYQLGSTNSTTSGLAMLTNVSFLNTNGESLFVGNSVLVVAIFQGGLGFSTKISESTEVAISGHNVSEYYTERILDPPEYSNFIINPDLLNNSGRLIGATLIFILLLIIFLLTWEYLQAINYWIKVFLIGRNTEKEES